MQLIDRNGTFVVDSREVAEMIGKRHDNLMRDIDGYVEILKKSTASNLRASVFFIGGSYQDSKGEIRRKYDLTRKGCDMVANKMSGEKGVLFTATYVTKFEEMEMITQFRVPQSMPEALRLAADLADKNETLRLENEHKEMIITELQPKARYVDQILKSKGTVTATQIAKDYGMTAPALNKILHDEGIQFKQNKQWLLYKKYADEGYTKSDTIDITRSNGDPDVTINTRWTQKGRLFIHEILRKVGIVPYMDREPVTT